jgi:hypothetical protein
MIDIIIITNTLSLKKNTKRVLHLVFNCLTTVVRMVHSPDESVHAYVLIVNHLTTLCSF